MTNRCEDATILVPGRGKKKQIDRTGNVLFIYLFFFLCCQSSCSQRFVVSSLLLTDLYVARLRLSDISFASIWVAVAYAAIDK